MSATAKQTTALFLAVLLTPFFTFASPTSVDRITDHIQPLIMTDYIKGQYFTATSTTASSTLPKLSSTLFGVGTICFTGDTCRTTWPSGNTYTGFNPITISAGNVIAIATSSASQSGFLSAIDFSLLHTATTTFSSPLSYSVATNAVTCPSCLLLDPNWAVVNGYLAPTTTRGILVNASSTIGGGTQTTGLTIFGGSTTTGNAIVQNTSASSLTVGPAGAVNPVLQIDSSVASQATGLSIKGVGTGTAGGTVLSTISSGTNDALTIKQKGSGTLILDTDSGGTVSLRVNADQRILLGAASETFSTAANASAATVRMQFNAPADTSLTAGTNAVWWQTNASGVTRSHANGALPLQEDLLFSGIVHAFSTFSASNIVTNLANMAVTYPTLGANALATNLHAIYIPTVALNASTTNAYGLTVNASTGATNNYAAQFLGGSVGVGLSSPLAATFEVQGTTTTSGGNALVLWNSASNNLFQVDDSGTTTARHGFNITGGGCFAIAGTCLTSGASFSGTLGQVDYFTGTNTAAGTSSIFISPAGRIGIGTITPTDVNANSRLTIAQAGATTVAASTTDNTTSSATIFDAYAPGARTFMGAHGTNQVVSRYGITLGGWGEIGLFNSTFGTANGLAIGTQPAVPMVFGTNNLERARITSGGNVGIGTTTPYGKFAIQLNATDTAYPGNFALNIASSTASATTTLFSISNTGVASTTQLQGAGLTACTGSTFLQWSAGLFSCGTPSGGSGGNSKWATSTGSTIIPNGGGGIIVSASSTIAGGLFTAAGGATTTQATITGNLYLNSFTGIVQGNGTAAATAITDSSTVGQVLRVTGSSAYAWGALNLASSNAVTGLLPLANGSTGTTTGGNTNGIEFYNGSNLTNSSLLQFNGTNTSLGATTTFGTLLNLNGIANFATATSTFYSTGGINLTAGCFAIAGTCVGGGGGVPGGSNTQVQFNDSSAFGGNANFTFSKTVSLLNLVGKLNIATTSSSAFNVADQYNTNRFTINTASSTGSSVPNILQILASTTNDVLFAVDDYGHLTASSTPKTPTVTCSPSGGTLSASSNDVTGSITTGTLSTSCALTFGAAYSVTPLVFLQQSGTVAILGVSAQSTTGFTVSLGTAATGDAIQYFVIMP